MKKIIFILMFLPLMGFSQIKVSSLTEATSLSASDLFMVVQGGATKKVQFFRFSYNQDSTALQIRDSLVYYVEKTEFSDSLLNYILRTELNDSLENYTSLDSLTYYMKTTDVRTAISDSIETITSVSLGTANQIPYVNSTSNDYLYSSKFKFDGSKFTMYSGNKDEENVYIGNSGISNTTGFLNTGIGVINLYSNTTGNLNTSLGNGAGYTNISGSCNIFLGSYAGFYSLGDSNIYIGYKAGYSETGSNKLYIENSNSATPLIYGNFADDSLIVNGTFKAGSGLIWNDTTLTLNYSNNILIGTTNFNNIIGGALSAESNTVMGANSGTLLTTGAYNTLIGKSSGYSITTADQNTLIGHLSGYSITTGENNTLIGASSGANIETGSNNVFLGYSAGSEEIGSNKLYIENSNSATPLIYGDFANDTVVINGYLKTTDVIHLFSYYGDSTISKSYTTDWAHLTNASGDMWIDDELDGFTVSGDTITIIESGDYDFKATNTLDGDNGETVSVRFYDVTGVAGIPIAGAFTARGAGNFHTITTEAYGHCDAGDKVVLQYKGDASGTSVFKNGIIKIMLIHK